MSACGGLALTFPYPRTNPVDFSKFFPSKDYQIVELQTKTNALRNEMAAALVEQDAEKVLRTIDEYLPYLLGIQRYVDESIEKEGKRPLIPDLEFQWTSSFSRRTGTFFTFYTLAFEFLMVYTCRMISEGNIAASQLDSVATPADYENAAKGALARVKAAAGIAAYIHENVLPLRESLPYKRPPEVLKDFFRPIVLLYKCTAQQIATKQAAIKGMNRSLVAKLYVTAAKLLAEVLQTMLFCRLESQDVVQCNVTLHQMDKDYNDFIPSLRAYSDGDSDMDTARIFFFIQLATCRRFEVSQSCCYEIHGGGCLGKQEVWNGFESLSCHHLKVSRKLLSSHLSLYLQAKP